MRTTKELLEVMLQHQNKFHLGLCVWVNKLRNYKTITFDEWSSLRAYIRENRPNKFSSLDCFIMRKATYYWSPNKINPRIKWIKKHIKKLS